MQTIEKFTDISSNLSDMIIMVLYIKTGLQNADNNIDIGVILIHQPISVV